MLKPVTVPPSFWNELPALKEQLAQLRQELAAATSVSLPASSASESSRALSSEKNGSNNSLSNQNLEQRITDLQAEIQVKEKISELDSGLEDGWVVNEQGEILNEEGLPMFDIHEDLPPEPAEATPKVQPIPSASKTAASKPRYIIKSKGKLVVGPTQPLRPKAEPTVPEARAFVSEEEKVEMNKLFDQLELEEVEEEKKNAEIEASIPSAFELEERANGGLVEEVVPKVESPAVVTKPTPTPKPFGFSSGFLIAKKPNKGKEKAVIETNPLNSDTSSTPPIFYEPLHHILPPAKSIYKPTPPSSRPVSPKPDRKVLFNVPANDQDNKVTSKKIAIPLPPPPSTSTTIEEAKDKEAADSKKAEPFVRPIKTMVIERPVKAPSAPNAKVSRFKSERDKVPKEDRLPATSGRPPKATDIEVPRNSVPHSIGEIVDKSAGETKAVEKGPIHTVSMGSASGAFGSTSIQEIFTEDLEDDDDGFDDESDSSGFYGTDNEDESDDMDIDGALHNREIALEYHRKRMDLGAGAGTGPLGGDRDSEAFDAWNQADVPREATMMGRVAGNNHSSRFRKGRLESAQMIIPSLLANNVRQDDGHNSEDDDDGLTVLERENIRITLEQLSNGTFGSGATLSTVNSAELEKEGRKIVKPGQESILSKLSTPSLPAPKPARAPPTVTAARVATPISIPSNGHFVDSPAETVALPAKKMSRFKARQLGLEFEE